MKPARYPPNTSAELEAIATLKNLLDSKHVIPHFRELDKIPNSDGCVELVDDERIPLGKLEVQIRKIPDGAVAYNCPIELVAYSETLSLPFLLICVDVTRKVAYFRHLHRAMPELSSAQKTFTVRFANHIDAITPASNYVAQWFKLIDEYNHRVHDYERQRKSLLRLKKVVRERSFGPSTDLRPVRNKFPGALERTVDKLENIPGIGSSGAAEVRTLLAFLGIRDAKIGYEVLESSLSTCEANLLSNPELGAFVRLRILDQKPSSKVLAIIHLRRLAAIGANRSDNLFPAVADCLLEPPKRLRGMRLSQWHWNRLPKEAIQDYGIKRRIEAIPYFKLVVPNCSAHACSMMAAMMMYQYLDRVPSLSDIVDLGRKQQRGNPNGSVINEHPSLTDVIDWFNRIPRIGAVSERVHGSHLGERVLRCGFEAIAGYVASGMPVILATDVYRMAGIANGHLECKSNIYRNNGLAVSEEWSRDSRHSGAHALIVVAVDLDNRRLVVNDPATVPFVVIEEKELFDVLPYHGANERELGPLDFVAVVPRGVRLPLFGSVVGNGLIEISALARVVLNPGDAPNTRGESRQYRLVRGKDLNSRNSALRKAMSVEGRLASSFLDELESLTLNANEWFWLEMINKSNCQLWRASRDIRNLPKLLSDFGRMVRSLLVLSASIRGKTLHVERFR